MRISAWARSDASCQTRLGVDRLGRRTKSRPPSTRLGRAAGGRRPRGLNREPGRRSTSSAAQDVKSKRGDLGHVWEVVRQCSRRAARPTGSSATLTAWWRSRGAQESPNCISHAAATWEGSHMDHEERCEDMFGNVQCERARGHGSLHQARWGTSPMMWADAPDLHRAPHARIAPPDDNS